MSDSNQLNSTPIDFHKLSKQELEIEVAKYGLKPTSMTDMINQLQKISQLTQPALSEPTLNNETLDIDHSLLLNQSLSEQITQYIKTCPELHQSILLYEPIDLAPFICALKASGIKGSTTDIRDFLDSQGIIYGDALSKRKRPNKKPPLRAAPKNPALKQI